MMITVDIGELIAFYDFDADSNCHAAAVKSIFGEEFCLQVLIGYLRGTKYERASILPDRCNLGKRSGKRLDAWVKASDNLLYQVEVKTWSAHSLGGRKLSATASSSELREFKIERWQHYWNGGAFYAEGLDKVLIPMKPPTTGMLVEPLACVWDAMHPEGGPAPFFSVPVNRPVFKRLNVFSVSSYLRGQKSKRIELDMPLTRERLSWLERIFPRAAAVARAR